MMNTQNTYAMGEARKKFTEILDKVLAGEEVILTKYNLPVVKVVKIDEDK